jgi:hypothetical protein
MKNILTVAIFFFLFSMHSQEKISNYKFIIVSDKFDFLKKPDMYQTSSLTKFLLKKNGFDAYLSSENLPRKVYDNRCKTLFVKILNSSSAFVTKNAVEFRDCNNVVVYKSKVGKSRKKDFKPAHHEAIRDAFTDLIIKGYNYQESAISKTNVVIKPVAEKTIKKIEVAPVKKVVKKSGHTIYAQPISNGFQLVDTTPKVVYTILTTSTVNLYIIKGQNGILYLRNSKWIAEYYENGQLIQKELQIKF